MSIIEFRNDIPPINQYPHRIVSPTAPSLCCAVEMARIGEVQTDATGQFYYQRCNSCGYTVRRFFGPSPARINEDAQKIRRMLAEMNLGTGTTRRRTREQVEQEIAAAERPRRLIASPPRRPRKPLAA